MSSTDQFVPIEATPRIGGLVKRHGRTAVGLVVSVVALGAVAWWVAHQPAPTLPDSASGFAWFALALAMTILTLTVRGWRWHRIMRLTGVDHRRTDAVGLTMVGYMGNTVLPARGGDLLRLGLLGARSSSRRREILGTVIAERLLDTVALGCIFVVLSLGLADSPAGAGVAAGVGGAIVLGFAALAGYLWLRRGGRFERFAAVVRPVARGLRLFAHPAGISLFILSVAIWSIDGLCLLVLARSIGLELAPLDAILVVALSALAAAVPAAPGFAGTFDAAMILALKAAGITGGTAVGLLILARFMFFVPATVIGLIVLVTRYGGLRRTLAAERLR